MHFSVVIALYNFKPQFSSLIWFPLRISKHGWMDSNVITWFFWIGYCTYSWLFLFIDYWALTFNYTPLISHPSQFTAWIFLYSLWYVLLRFYHSYRNISPCLRWFCGINHSSTRRGTASNKKSGQKPETRLLLTSYYNNTIQNTQSHTFIKSSFQFNVRRQTI